MSRKAQPNCFRYFLGHFQQQTAVATATVDQLITLLMDEAGYDKSTATETVSNAIIDGLLKTTSVGQKTVRLPKTEEITPLEKDCYCFECHLAGVLEYCRLCTRSFHRLCYRKDPERPNYSVPSAKVQKNRLPIFSSDTDSSENGDGEEVDGNASTARDSSTVLDYESDARAVSSLLPTDQISNITEGGVVSLASPLSVPVAVDIVSIGAPVITALNTEHFEGKPYVYALHTDLESKGKLDVVCLGEVRPPTRKRPATTASNRSYKSEVGRQEDEQENETDTDLCTCCRLMKIKTLRNPPNLQTDELCHLLSFIFARNRSWISVDVPYYLEVLKASPDCIEITAKLLFNIPFEPLEKLNTKIHSQKYAYLMDFLVDILDIQHNIGIFFGHNSTELESTKWMVRDVTHELSELRRCFDCFRYSNEKDTNLWFAKPCVQRHELVFAKHSGFPYWPAKVVRVLANNKYDVRFFGGNHSRALIESRFIRPIDTDVKSLKLGNSPAMKKALEELHYHQILSKYPPNKFSFHADKKEMEEIIHTVLGMGGRGKGKGKRGRRSKKTTGNSMADIQQHQQQHAQTSAVIISITPTAALNNEPTTPSRSIIQCVFSNDDDTSPTAAKTRRITRSVNNSTTTNENSLKDVLEELDKAHDLAKAEEQKRTKLQKKVQKLEDLIKKHEAEKSLLKRKQWCYWCLSEAIYLCCFRAAYCSKLCQERHWKDGHNKECRNTDSLKNNSYNNTS